MSKHKVKEGDTPNKIAQKYKISEKDFYSWNPGLTASNLKMGKEYYVVDPNIYLTGTKRNWGWTKHWGNFPVYTSKIKDFDRIFAQAKKDGHEKFFYDRNGDGNLDKNELFSTQTHVQWKPPHAQSQDDYARKVWNYLTKERGLTKEQASAIMGNIMQESSMGLFIDLKNGDKAKGAMQLHGVNLQQKNKMFGETDQMGDIKYLLNALENPVEADWRLKEYNRLKPLYHQAIEKEDSTRTKQDNEYIKLWESTFKNEPDTISNSWLEMSDIWHNNPNDLNTLTDVITTHFEKAGKPEFDKRRGYALEYYNSYGLGYKQGGIINKFNYFNYFN